MTHELLLKGVQLTIAVSAEKCYIVNSDEATNSIVAPNTLNENLKPGEKQNYQVNFIILLFRKIEKGLKANNKYFNNYLVVAACLHLGLGIFPAWTLSIL